MSSYREHQGDFDPSTAQETPPPEDVAAVIGPDERRMHVRAYNYWVGLLDGRDFPSIEDLEPAEVDDFAANSVLLDFTCGRDNPALPYVGPAIREECELSDDTRTIADVPSRSLLSRLTDHYMQIIANRAPVGFEAEFENPRGESICYRGILMPFSSDGEAIDFIYGVINWKRVDELATPASAPAPVEDVAEEPRGIEIAGLADEAEALPEFVDEDEPFELTEMLEPGPVLEEEAARPFEPEAALDSQEEVFEPAPATQEEPSDSPPPVHFSWEDGPLADADDVPIVELDENAGLADRLWAARETAESVKAGEGRTRAALYKALSLAYDFAIAAQASPEDYAELLEESGVKAQARAPMTPIVKLVFGIDYDKARLTEFAAALSYAQRQDVQTGEFQGFIEKQPGGLKALVAAERQARRPDTKPDSKGDVARARLRSAPVISLADVPAGEEFAVIVTRRGPDGTHEPVAIVDDEALIERAIRRSA
ncbi:MAG TPA: hypothetical protein VFI88_04770 [Sphingomicrobium sp.]|nr:hypothetical protein [Sphingomicrobium sp.]